VILYLDTSALVKLYVDETDSEKVREWAEEAELVATCRVAYPETVSAFTRRFRTGDLAKEDYEELLRCLADDWVRYVTLDFSELEAGALVKRHGLRDFDAVHLSAAKIFEDKLIGTGILSFSSFNNALNKAAIDEGLNVLSP
jgi:uncharacterized protein